MDAEDGVGEPAGAGREPSCRWMAICTAPPGRGCAVRRRLQADGRSRRVGSPSFGDVGWSRGDHHVRGPRQLARSRLRPVMSITATRRARAASSEQQIHQRGREVEPASRRRAVRRRVIASGARTAIGNSTHGSRASARGRDVRRRPAPWSFARGRRSRAVKQVGPVAPAGKTHVPFDGEVREQTVVLGQVADPASLGTEMGPAGGVEPQLVAEHDTAGAVAFKPRDHAQQRCLAGTGRPDDRDRLGTDA